jgi:hypothetical protein
MHTQQLVEALSRVEALARVSWVPFLKEQQPPLSQVDSKSQQHITVATSLAGDLAIAPNRAEQAARRTQRPTRMDTVSATAAGFSSRRSQLRFASSKVALSFAESSSASNSTTGVVPWRTSGSMSTVFLLYERSGAPRRAAGATASARERRQKVRPCACSAAQRQAAPPAKSTTAPVKVRSEL